MSEKYILLTDNRLRLRSVCLRLAGFYPATSSSGKIADGGENLLARRDRASDRKRYMFTAPMY